ncbi:MAG: CPBP family intramembrane glutamic endopeptidase [Planctomycetota bacterium]
MTDARDRDPDRAPERESGPDPDLPPPPAAVVTVAVVVYGLMITAALVWLSWRDRLGELPRGALGQGGLWGGAGAGLATGLAFAGLLALAARLPPIARCERRFASLLGPLSEAAVLALSLGAAIAEELFFRLAVQDAIGPIGAVACYVVVNTGPGFWPWLPVAVAAGALFSGLVHAGCGLFAATLAHALINYLTLRRILPT